MVAPGAQILRLDSWVQVQVGRVAERQPLGLRTRSLMAAVDPTGGHSRNPSHRRRPSTLQRSAHCEMTGHIND